jgi:hypothetical protein
MIPSPRANLQAKNACPFNRDRPRAREHRLAATFRAAGGSGQRSQQEAVVFGIHDPRVELARDTFLWHWTQRREATSASVESSSGGIMRRLPSSALWLDDDVP